MKFETALVTTISFIAWMSRVVPVMGESAAFNVVMNDPLLPLQEVNQDWMDEMNPLIEKFELGQCRNFSVIKGEPETLALCGGYIDDEVVLSHPYTEMYAKLFTLLIADFMENRSRRGDTFAFAVQESGSGAIPLHLAQRFPNLNVWMIEMARLRSTFIRKAMEANGLLVDSEKNRTRVFLNSLFKSDGVIFGVNGDTKNFGERHVVTPDELALWYNETRVISTSFKTLTNRIHYEAQSRATLLELENNGIDDSAKGGERRTVIFMQINRMECGILDEQLKMVHNPEIYIPYIVITDFTKDPNDYCKSGLFDASSDVMVEQLHEAGYTFFKPVGPTSLVKLNKENFFEKDKHHPSILSSDEVLMTGVDKYTGLLLIHESMMKNVVVDGSGSGALFEIKQMESPHLLYRFNETAIDFDFDSIVPPGKME